MFPIHPDQSSPEEEQPVVPPEEETPISSLPIVGEGAALPIVEGQPALPAALLPPEAQGEANGGPLGCCLGTVVGLLLTFLLSLGLSILLSNGGVLGFATIPVIIAGTIAGGVGGWKIGRWVYKEYEPPVVKRQVRVGTGKKKKRRSSVKVG